MRIAAVVLPAQDWDAVGFVTYAKISLDDEFIVRDMKVIRRPSGELLVAMPNEPYRDICGHCCRSNAVTASFCNWCGRPLGHDRAERDPTTGKPMLYRDIAFPRTREARAQMETAVLAAFDRARASAQAPPEPGG